MALPALIGAELAGPLSLMQGVMQDIKRNRGITRSQVAALNDSLAWAQRIAQQSQQIPRLAGGRLRQSHERLSLDQMLMDVVVSRGPLFRKTGVEIEHHLRQVDVIVDPGLLCSLLEVVVDWAVEQGKRLQLSLTIKNWPEYGVLVLKASQHVATADDARGQGGADTLNWHMLQQIAQVMGLMVDRVVGTDHTVLRIEFPRTVKELEGLTAVEVDVGRDSHSRYSDSKPLAGHRLLLVTADRNLRAHVKHICSSLGLVMDTALNPEHAVRFCEQDKPHVIVIDQELRDEIFEELREDLLRSDINFPFVEIARDSNTFEMSNWMGGSISRISRDVLDAQLPSILAMELAKVL
ncbi:hypothetical protein [uncultured Ramlibacter sp.]|uniref:hypothetical protein n=1 Tax=uncultured Ramlibacter sp. TaxID=260755 RepID=UPI0026081CDB|nr:hypothetical protein [uncultured Ramlibacter sp.]